MTDNRNFTLDVARGIAMLIVTFFHMVSFPRGGFPEALIRWAIWLIIPFFFLLSGFLGRKNMDHTFSQDIRHLVRRLLFPTLKYTSTGLVIGGIYFALLHGYTFYDFFRDVIDTYLRPEFASYFMADSGSGTLFDLLSPVWFVWTFMFSSVLFYALANFSSRSLSNLSLCCLILLGVSISVYDFHDKVSWGLTLVPMYTALMLCGLHIKRTHKLAGLSEVKYPFAASIILFVIHFVIFLTAGTYFVFMNLTGDFGRFSVITFFLQTFIGSSGLVLFSMSLLRFRKLSGILAFIGKNTLIFLVFHRLFGAIFSDLFGTFIRTGEYWDIAVTPEIFVKSFLTWICGLLCCGFLCKGIKKQEVKQ